MMSAPGRQAGGTHGGDHRCADCGTLLAADNTARLCSRCHREQRDQLRTPPAHLKTEFFETDEFRAAFEKQHMGQVFRAYRNHPHFLQLNGKALNQELLGRWLGLNQEQVSRIENGKPEQNIEKLRNYATILHLPHDMLWFKFLGENGFGWETPNNNRAAGVEWRRVPPDQRTTSAITTLIMQAAAESAKFGLRHEVSELHASSIEQIEEEVRRLSIDFVAGDPLETFMRSRQLRDDIFALLEKRALPRQEQMLYAFGARTCGYLAAASSDFYGQYEAAADQCRVARRFSDVADYPELRAWALSLYSAVSFWQGNWSQAASLAERAGELAITRSGMLRATSMHVRALARLGNVERLQAITRGAETRLTDNQGEDENGMILFSDANYLRNLGTANLWAGKSLEALEQLTRALRAYASDTPENFAVIATIRADLTLAFLNERDVEGADEAFSPLLEMEADRRLEGTLRRSRSLRSLLQSKEYGNSSAANDLLLHIEEFLATSRRIPELS